MVKSKNPLRIWALTINSPHPTEDRLPSRERLGEFLKKICKSFTFSKEIGSQGEGRYHYQCVINLQDKYRTRNPASLLYKMETKEFDYKYWEFQPCENYKALELYCGKDPVDGVVSRYNRKHVPPQHFNYKTLNHAQLGIKACIEKYAGDRSVFVFCNPEGNIGKTEFCKQLMMTDAVVFSSSVGSCDAIANQCVRDLAYFNNDPSISRIYLIFDITKTSPFLYKERLSQLASIMESAVSGILISSFGTGKSHKYFAEAGKCVPIIMTNEMPQRFAGMFSRDRLNCFIYKHQDRNHQNTCVSDETPIFDKWFRVWKFME